MMKKLNLIIIYTLLALVALFTKACECENEKDSPVIDNYCVKVSDPSVSLSPGGSTVPPISISNGGCDPVVKEVLPWSAFSNAKELAVEVTDPNNPAGTGLRITSVPPKEALLSFSYLQEFTVIVGLAGPGIKGHQRRVYNNFINVRVISPNLDTLERQIGQQFKVLISTDRPLLRFKTSTIQSLPIAVINRSTGLPNLDVTVSVSTVTGSNSGTFAVTKSRLTLGNQETVTVTFGAGIPGTTTNGELQLVAFGQGTTTTTTKSSHVTVPLLGISQ